MDATHVEYFSPAFLRRLFGDSLICWHGCRTVCDHRRYPAWKIHGYRMLNAEWEGRGAERYVEGFRSGVSIL